MRFFLIFFLGLVFGAGPASAAQPVQQLLQLVDYVGVDYGGAVSAGAVSNEAEYEEMADFAATIRAASEALPAAAASDRIRANARRLETLVAAKGDPAEVSRVAAELRGDLIDAYELAVVPRKSPDLQLGGRLFADNCTSCHGAGGEGNGPLAATLTPPPTDFTDRARYRERTLFGLYNTITHGVQGTEMKGFTQLSDAQRWSLAFYVGQLAPPAEQKAAGEALLLKGEQGGELFDARRLTTMTPADAEARFGEQGGQIMAYLRGHPQSLFGQGESSLAFARHTLAESLAAYRAGRVEQAQRLAVSAYLDGVEPVEGNLDAVDAALRRQVESGMTGYRGMLKKGEPVAAVAAQAERVSALLKQAEGVLGSTRLSPGAAFVSSMVILLREGLEAILVIAALAAFLIKTGRRDGLRYLYAGILAALGLGGVTWVLSSYVFQIGGAGRELTEGFAALFAAVMLFYVGFWINSKTGVAKWKAFIEGSIKKALGRGSLWGLAGLAFIAVYREFFETVLFYQSLWLQTGEEGRGMIFTAFLVAAALLALLGWMILRYSTRLPLRQFFSVTGVFMFALAIVFTGKGIAALQEAGKIPVNPIDFPRIDLLGIYPNIGGLVVQLLLAVIAVLMLLRERNSGRRPA